MASAREWVDTNLSIWRRVKDSPRWPTWQIAITYHRGRISDCLNAPGGNTDQRSRERVEKLHGAMIAFYQSIDPSLMFSVQSFKVYRDLHQSPTFWLLHMLFHSVVRYCLPRN